MVSMKIEISRHRTSFLSNIEWWRADGEQTGNWKIWWIFRSNM